MEERVRELVEFLERQVAEPTVGLEEVLERTVDTLSQALPHYTWVGIYLVEDDELVLGPFRGEPTVHTRIPVGQGICGWAAKARETVVVPDVSQDERYLACFPSTKSELVAPILWQGEALGEIDVDSDQLDAFGEDDVALLEGLAERLAAIMAVETPPLPSGRGASQLRQANRRQVVLGHRGRTDGSGGVPGDGRLWRAEEVTPSNENPTPGGVESDFCLLLQTVRTVMATSQGTC